ncbi:MAG TPA: hypothetical protein VH542_03420 [Steroidobacteraceae bacterium]
MSPLWRDEVSIRLAPRRLALVRHSRGLKPRKLAVFEVAVEPDDAVSWRAALTALSRCLGEPPWQAANVRVVLSDLWVRYAIVPWSDELHGNAERLTHARYALADIYGDLVADWTVRLSDPVPGKAQVACAMPTTLFTELSDLIEQRGLHLLSLQPQLIAAFNRWRERLPESGAWFVSIEEGALAAARLAPGGWDRVHVVRIGRDWAVELKRLNTFARLAGTRPEEGRVFVDAPESLRSGNGDEPGLEWLDAAIEETTPGVVQAAGDSAARGSSA